MHIKIIKIYQFALFKEKQKIDYGILEMKKNILQNFKEKPSLNLNVSMGIYFINKKILKILKINFLV